MFLYFIKYHSSNDITPQRLEFIQTSTIFMTLAFIIFQFIIHIMNRDEYVRKLNDKEEYLRNHISIIMNEIEKNKEIEEK